MREVTGAQMCEEIAAEAKKRFGLEIEPMDIWNCDRHGELWPVFLLHSTFCEPTPAPPDGMGEDPEWGEALLRAIAQRNPRNLQGTA